MKPKTGVIDLGRPKTVYVSPKDDRELASLDLRKEWGNRKLEKWLENRVWSKPTLSYYQGEIIAEKKIGEE